MTGGDTSLPGAGRYHARGTTKIFRRDPIPAAQAGFLNTQEAVHERLQRY